MNRKTNPTQDIHYESDITFLKSMLSRHHRGSTEPPLYDTGHHNGFYLQADCYSNDSHDRNHQQIKNKPQSNNSHDSRQEHPSMMYLTYSIPIIRRVLRFQCGTIPLACQTVRSAPKSFRTLHREGGFCKMVGANGQSDIASHIPMSLLV